MKQYDKVTPDRTKDLLFEECDLRQKIANQISSVFESHGYYKVITPNIEYYDVFASNFRSYPQESMYKLVDNNGRLLVLRPDSTTPIARLVSTKLKNITPPYRLYYSQNVYRINKSMSGRSDEIFQIGAELVGANSANADLEIISTAIEALEEIGITDFRFEIGHIGIFNSLISQLPINSEQRDEIRELVNSKNYPALNDILTKMPQIDAVKALMQLPRLFGGEEVLDKALDLLSDQSYEILTYLKSLYSKLCGLNMNNNLTLDLGLVNENIYYTGVIFKAYISGSGEAVLSGGRYDKLLEDFGENLDAIGFGIDVDTVAKAIGNTSTTPDPVDVLIYSANNNFIDAIKYSKILKSKGVLNELSFNKSLDDAVIYAKSKGIKKVVVFNDNIETMNVTEVIV